MLFHILQWVEMEDPVTRILRIFKWWRLPLSSKQGFLGSVNSLNCYSDPQCVHKKHMHFSGETICNFHQILKGICNPKMVRSYYFANVSTPGQGFTLANFSHQNISFKTSFCLEILLQQLMQKENSQFRNFIILNYSFKSTYWLLF